MAVQNIKLEMKYFYFSLYQFKLSLVHILYQCSLFTDVFMYILFLAFTWLTCQYYMRVDCKCFLEVLLFSRPIPGSVRHGPYSIGRGFEFRVAVLE